MLQSLILNNFRGKSCQFEFYPNMNFVMGKNGAGKSTIKEALCYLYTQRDSANSSSVDHLATFGRAVAFYVEGKEVTKQYTSPLDRELFLSVFIPGFFLNLGPEKQNRILNTLLPNLDKLEVARTLSGASDEEILVHLPRSNPTLSVANLRRNLEKRRVRVEVEIEKCRETLGEEQQETALIDSFSNELAMLELQKKDFDRWVNEFHQWESRKRHYDYHMGLNKSKLERRNELESTIHNLQMKPLPEYHPVQDEINRLQNDLLPLPAKPNLRLLPDSEHCFTCGQVISSRFKESHTALNRKIMEQYEQELEEIQRRNLVTQNKIKELALRHTEQKKNYENVVHENDITGRTKQRLMKELTDIVLVNPEEPGVCPKRPDFDLDRYEELVRKRDFFVGEKAKHESKQNQYKKSEEDLGMYLVELEDIDGKIARFKKLEKAFASLPMLELEHKIRAFNLGEGVELSINEGLSIKKDGIPYKLLSYGQKLKLDIRICLKLNSLMTEPINMIFIDDADLLDTKDLAIEGVQVFASVVTGGELYVKQTFSSDDR